MATLRRTVAAAALSLAGAAAFSSAPVVSALPATSALPAAAPADASGYLPSSLDKAQNARLQAALDTAIAQAEKNAASGAKRPGPQAAAVIYYDDTNAPTYDSLIDQGAAIWNSRVANVKLVERDGAASLVYREGNGQGSYYQGRGRGDGQIFIDHAQAAQYYTLRIVTHETGHALGLPDRYTQPCSKLMSGGGPGTSCTNAYPDSVEASEVNTLWN
ncbi:snapalysin family zinc-dependent metalloprotease [Knoellia sp. CPCC 206453]|uniref:snapalysin family zinc-dependent metalloprotease n=1 Tax=Knoellia pratensis TaxID=3404796 RepID=UPI003611FB3E